MNRWSHFRALSWREQSTFLQALFLLAAAPLLLRWTRFRRGPSIVGRPRSGGGRLCEPESRITEARAIARTVAAAASHRFVRARCLEHSLALWWLLRRRGIDCDLRLGVRRAEGSCEAHAWVEARGFPLSDPGKPHRRFSAFDVALIPVVPISSVASDSRASMTCDISSTR